jgi:hypothetical protein
MVVIYLISLAHLPQKKKKLNWTKRVLDERKYGSLERRCRDQESVELTARRSFSFLWYSLCPRSEERSNRLPSKPLTLNLRRIKFFFFFFFFIIVCHYQKLFQNAFDRKKKQGIKLLKHFKTVNFGSVHKFYNINSMCFRLFKIRSNIVMRSKSSWR